LPSGYPANRCARSSENRPGEYRPVIYFQFDGFEPRTYDLIRGEPDIREEKLRGLGRLAEVGCNVILLPAVERGVNAREVSGIVPYVTAARTCDAQRALKRARTATAT
jgi:uncharacterized radical SAM superfamily Fe-S cluster-containing enzyme